MRQELHTAHGTFRYRIAGHTSPPQYWLVIDVDQEITRYARSLLKSGTWNTHPIQLPKYAAHISVIKRVSDPSKLNLKHWGRYNGEQVEFTYTNYINNHGKYYALTAFCPRANEVRAELGLNRLFYDFHITIGNTKNIR